MNTEAKLINLIHPEKSEVSYTLFKFNDGEPHIKFTEEINHKCKYNVITRITDMDSLFVLLQVGDILDRHGIIYDIYITYLMTMRMDRVMTFNEAFSLKVMSNFLNSIHPENYYIFEPHSERTYDLINNARPYYMVKAEIINNLQNYSICFPDKGAAQRYEFSFFNRKSEITLNKTRDVNTGNITGMEIVDDTNTEDPENILIIDDLCDGGRTFIEAYKILHEKYPSASIEIFVVHMVNPNGLTNLMNTFDKVYTTDSYKDYKSTLNLTVYNCYV